LTGDYPPGAPNRLYFTPSGPKIFHSPGPPNLRKIGKLPPKNSSGGSTPRGKLKDPNYLGPAQIGLNLTFFYAPYLKDCEEEDTSQEPWVIARLGGIL